MTEMIGSRVYSVRESDSFRRVEGTGYGTLYKYEDYNRARRAEDRTKLQFLGNEILDEKYDGAIPFGIREIPYENEFKAEDRAMQPWDGSDSAKKRAAIMMNSRVAVWQRFRCCWPYYDDLQLCSGCSPQFLDPRKKPRFEFEWGSGGMEVRDRNECA